MVKCWDLETNKVIRHYHGHLSGVYALALHPTLDVLVTSGRDATARVSLFVYFSFAGTIRLVLLTGGGVADWTTHIFFSLLYIRSGTCEQNRLCILCPVIQEQ